MALASAGDHARFVIAVTQPAETTELDALAGCAALPQPSALVPRDAAIQIETRAPPQRAVRRRPIAAAVLSTVLHLLVLVVLALVVMPRDLDGDQALQLLWLPDPYAQEVIEKNPEAPVIQFTGPNSARDVADDLEPDGGSGLEAPPPQVELIPLPAGAAERGDQGTGNTDGDATGDLDGTGSGGDGSGEKTATFFEVEAIGDRFAFVVDASGSMHGPRYHRAVKEIVYTLKRLGKDQQFYVVLFNKYDFPQFHPDRTKVMLPATADNIAKVEQWLRGFTPRENTQPIPALRKALQIDPDAVFFLSDGAFTPRVLSLLRQYNRESRTVIHTIALENRDGEALLKRIAREHKGSYLFVDE